LIPRGFEVAPWLRGYNRTWLSRDIVGGLAAGAVVIPQAMAYATVADLPVEVGLYTCMVLMAVYALLGGSRTLVLVELDRRSCSMPRSSPSSALPSFKSSQTSSESSATSA
jgi:MFS superfamily sulfate permease-like transporter